MLTKIREKTQGIIATFILSLIAVIFAIWGIGPFLEEGTNQVVAKVNDTEISQQAYRNALEQLRGTRDPAVLNSRAFKELVLSGLIEQTLLVQDADARGLRTGDEQLLRLLQSVSYFQRDGKFDRELYLQFLRREGMGERQFENRLRGEVVTRQVQSGFTESVMVTDAELTAVARLYAQERVVAHALVSPDAFAARATASGEEIEKYYEANAEQFKTPEQVRVLYLRLSLADLGRKYRPTEDELRRAYDEEAARYATPEKRRVAHILVAVAADASDADQRKAMERIQSVERQLKGGASFATVAKRHSDDKDSGAKGGELGELRPGLLPDSLMTTARALKLNEVSAPVRTEYGYHVVTLTGIVPAKRRPFAEVRKELEQRVRNKMAEDRYIELADKFRDLIYTSPESLATAAHTLELEIQESGWFTRSGGSGIAQNLKVVEAAFQPEVLSKARNSDAIEVDAQTLVAVRVADHKPAARLPLAQVRAQIERALKEQAAARQAADLARQVFQALRESGRLEALAARHGLKLQLAKRITRDKPAGTDPRIVEAAFRAARPQDGKPSYQLAELGRQGFALVAVSEVKDVDPARLDAAVKDRARRMLAERRGAGYYADYRAGLHQSAKIKIYSERL